ncbi:MAG: nucleoside triphosphate pyrophosphatase [Granulosicoccus sp.]
MQALVLGSSSRYRRELLERLMLPFSILSPDIDESALANEEPQALAQRLADSKALAVHQQLQRQGKNADTVIIASDQVASVDGGLLGKPQTVERARSQLESMAGREIVFHTALHLLDTSEHQQFTHADRTIATLRALSAEEIDRYIAADQPLDCAGSFKVESLGISLFEKITTEDPTALIGLPLIALAHGLREFGIAVP